LLFAAGSVSGAGTIDVRGYNLNSITTTNGGTLKVFDSDGVSGLTGSISTGRTYVAQAFLTWDTGGGTTAWDTANNWDPDLIPSSSANVIIPSGCPRYPDVTTGVTATCNNLTINSGGSLALSGGTINVYGSWTNNNTFTATSGTVTFAGTAAAAVGGTSGTAFYNLTVNKGAFATAVTQNAAVTVSATLDIQQGTFVTNGYALTVSGSTTGTGAQNGKLDVTIGGTVNLASIDQYNNLANMAVSGTPTVNISGNHNITNSGQRCDISGGTVNYTSTGTNLTLQTNNAGWGWYATGGTISFSGSIWASTTTFFQASGTAIVKFVGATNQTITLQANASSNVWGFNDLRIEKTGGASVTAQTTAGSLGVSATAATGLTVNSGAVFNMGGAFSGTLGWDIVNFSNSGTTTQNCTYLYVSGNWANSGTFNANSYYVYFDGATDSEILGTSTTTFYIVYVSKAATTNSLIPRVNANASLQLHVVTGIFNMSPAVDADTTFTVSNSLSYVYLDGEIRMDAGDNLSTVGLLLNSGAAEVITGGTITLTGSGSTFMANSGSDFTPTGGTVAVNGSCTYSNAGTVNFYDLTLNALCQPSATDAQAQTLDINGSLVINGVGSLNMATGSTVADQSVTIAGNWTNGGSFSPGSGTVTFDGTGTRGAPQQIAGTAQTNFYRVDISSTVVRPLVNAGYSLQISLIGTGELYLPGTTGTPSVVDTTP
jgi:hypothetical protein